MATATEPASAPNMKYPLHASAPEYRKAKEHDIKIPPLVPVTGSVKREQMDAMMATIGEITGISGMNDTMLMGMLDDAHFAPIGHRSTKKTFVRKDKRSCQRLSFGSEGVGAMMPILDDIMEDAVKKYPNGTCLHVEPSHFDAMLYRNRDGGRTGGGGGGSEPVINDHFDFHRDGEFMFGHGDVPFGTLTYAQATAGKAVAEEIVSDVPTSNMMQYSLLICVDANISDHTSGNTDVYLPSDQARWLNYWAINAMDGTYDEPEIEWRTDMGPCGSSIHLNTIGKHMRLHSFPQSRTPLKYVIIPGNALHRGNSIDCSDGYKMILKFDLFIDMPVPTVSQIVSEIETDKRCDCLYCSPAIHMKGTNNVIDMASKTAFLSASKEPSPSAQRIGGTLPTELRSMIVGFLMKQDGRPSCKEDRCVYCSASTCDCRECVGYPESCSCSSYYNVDNFYYENDDDEFCNGYKDW